MFKKSLLTLSLIALSGSVLSAPIANLKVNGDIKPPTCTVNGLEQNDVIFNYGVISPSMIPQSDFYTYPSGVVKNSIIVECDASTYLTFIALDTYSGSNLTEIPNNLNKDYFFHLVVPDSDNAIGAAIFRWENVMVDGLTAYISKANDGSEGSLSHTTGQYILTQGTTSGFTKEQQRGIPKESLNLIAGKIFSFDIRQPDTSTSGFSTFLLSRDNLISKNIDVSEGVDFIGEAVMTFNFGV
ncbi:fimbrial protein (plasmid) [Providencia rettgeri]|uniref:fimbrial protein n=1 Tax=Providencia rettgeri TaxID=587 RepID=UPI001CA7662E|nr:fimbrial protein [Providencia rettgeri]QZY66548.1 fimbrial protein [Providencia rettgeri]